MAAFVGLELGISQLLVTARDSQDAATRKGAAFLCAHRLPHTTDATAAAAALRQFVYDEDDEVRKAAAEVAAALRGRALRPFAAILKTLIASPALSLDPPHKQGCVRARRRERCPLARDDGSC
jgi:hypothetical protein